MTRLSGKVRGSAISNAATNYSSIKKYSVSAPVLIELAKRCQARRP
jgi:hypothetical protein